MFLFSALDAHGCCPSLHGGYHEKPNGALLVSKSLEKTLIMSDTNSSLRCRIHSVRAFGTLCSSAFSAWQFLYFFDGISPKMIKNEKIEHCLLIKQRHEVTTESFYENFNPNHTKTFYENYPNYWFILLNI